MHVEERAVGLARCVVTYARGKSPLSVSLTPEDARDPAYGALVYAIPRMHAKSDSTENSIYASVLISNDEFNETSKQIAKVLAKRLSRPAFVTASVVGDMHIYADVANLVVELLDKEG